jgi:hypothetical protein
VIHRRETARAACCPGRFQDEDWALQPKRTGPSHFPSTRYCRAKWSATLTSVQGPPKPRLAGSRKERDGSEAKEHARRTKEIKAFLSPTIDNGTLRSEGGENWAMSGLRRWVRPSHLTARRCWLASFLRGRPRSPTNSISSSTISRRRSSSPLLALERLRAECDQCAPLCVCF